TFSDAGERYRLADALALRRPVQQPLPIIIGGGGPRRAPALAARFASEFNVGFSSVDKGGQGFERVRQACEEIGRNPDSIVMSLAHTTAVGRDEAEHRRRSE